MEAVKNKEGIITHYKEWNGSTESAENVFNKILNIQAKQLAEWKLRLNDTVYNALEQAIKEANKGLTAQTHNAYDCIKRGCSMSSFISNWRPNKQINQIYW